MSAVPRVVAASDPISSRCLAFALERQGALLDALEIGAEDRGVSPEQIGVLLGGDPNPHRPRLRSLLRSELWQMARQLGLDVPPGLARFFPALVTLPGAQGRAEAAVCWLGPLPAAGPGGVS
jgi:hypothetical protein